MYPVFESIKIDQSGIYNWDYHATRMQRTSMQLWHSHIELKRIVDALQNTKTSEILKCKLYYNHHSFEYETSIYHKRDIRKLILFENHSIEYALKFTNRDCFHQPISVKEDTEFLYCRHGLLTDSSYSNIVLWNGEQWHTPKSPLLLGTKRASLLDKQTIVEKDISIESLGNYQKISLINAMLDIGDIELDMGVISTLNSY